MKKIYIALSSCLLAVSLNAQQTFTTFQAASLVIGQPNFTTQNTTTDQNTNYGTTSSVISSQGVLAIGSQTARRILIWNQVPTANGTPANIVLGQPTFTSSLFGCSQSQMSYVEGIAFSPDGTKLIAADAGNNRVLIWNTIPTTNGQNADVVIGQTNFTNNSFGVTANTLNYPTGVAVTASGKLIISDYNNSRILIYNSIPTTNGASADVVIGQTSFTTAVSGCSSTLINHPWYLTVAPSGQLVVADHYNHRSLIYNTIPTVNGVAADFVIGQPNFTTNIAACSANQANYPIGVTSSPDGKLAIAEFGNNRVMIYNTIPTANGVNADVVLGQPNFTVNTAFNGGVTAQSMRTPYGIWFDLNSRLFVNGRDMHRVMVYGSVPTQTADLSITINSTSGNLCLNSPVNYTVTVTNNGPNTASNVVVNTALPSQFTLSSSNASSGSYTAASGWWNIPSINSGSNAVLVLNGNVAGGVSQTITAYANITNSQQLDNNLSNNGSSATVAVGAGTPPSGGSISGPSVTCSGSSYTFAVSSVTNATNYSWLATGGASVTGSGTLVTVLFGSNNSNISVVPSNSLCTGASLNQSVSVNPLPTVTISSSASTVCAGSTVSLNANGANTYSWSTGASTASISVSPTTTATYSVIGTNTTGCSKTSTVSVSVNALPVINASSSTSLLCTGNSATLTATGANTYTWNTAATTSVIVVSPTVTTTYSVNGTDANGCANSFTISQAVSACSGIAENGKISNNINLYPNPNNGSFTIEAQESIISMQIVDLTGKTVVAENNINSNNFKVKSDVLSGSVYMIKVQLSSGSIYQSRLIVQK